MNTKKTLILISIVCTLFIEIGFFNYPSFINRIKENQNIVYTYENIETLNWEKDLQSNKMISNADPILVINHVDCYVNNIMISGETNRENMSVQVFYTNDLIRQFDENISIRSNFEFNNDKLISINKKISTMRIDLGDQAGTELKNLKIIINPNTLDIKVSRVLVIGIMIWLIIRYVVYNRKDIVRLIKTRKDVALAIFIIIMIRTLFYSSIERYFLTPDSYDYIGIESTRFLQFNLHEIRTPVYPIIIDLCKKIFGNQYYLEGIVMIQISLSAISLVLMYKVLKLATRNNIISIFIVVFYGCSTSIMGWDKTILTESLALTGTVIFIYLLMGYLYIPTKKKAILASLFPLLLTLLRPTFLILYPIIIIFWILRYTVKKEERGIVFLANLCAIVGMTCLLLYAGKFHNQFRTFSLSNTLMRQELVLCIEEGYYKNFEDKDLVYKIDTSIRNSGGNYLEGINVVYQEYDDDQIKQFIKKSKLDNKVSYLRDKMGIIIELGKVPFPNNTWHGFNQNEAEFNQEYVGNTYYGVKGGIYRIVAETIRSFIPALTFAHIYIIIIIEIILIIYCWVKKKEIRWISMGIATIMSATIVGAVIGTYAEWARTAICVIPYAYIAIARYLRYFIEYVVNDNR